MLSDENSLDHSSSNSSNILWGKLHDFDYDENYEESESKASKTITIDNFHKVVSRVITDARGHSSSDEDGRFKRHTLR